MADVNSMWFERMELDEEPTDPGIPIHVDTAAMSLRTLELLDAIDREREEKLAMTTPSPRQARAQLCDAWVNITEAREAALVWMQRSKDPVKLRALEAILRHAAMLVDDAIRELEPKH